jgi:predicted nucleic acid-binding protein
MKLLLDTNVLIDYFAQRDPFYADALHLYAMRHFGDAELWASIHSFADISYILRNEAESQTLQDAFLSSLDFLHVCSLTQDDLIAAAQAKWDDFEDCLVEQCAQKIKADYLLSRDKTGFTNAKTKVITPSSFFRALKEERGLSYEEVGF